MERGTKGEKLNRLNKLKGMGAGDRRKFLKKG